MESNPLIPKKGRGALTNPTGRFERIDASYEPDAHTLLRLPYNLKDHFEQWLEVHAPLRKQKVLNRIREMRGGKLYQSQWGQRMRGEGEYYDSLTQPFAIHKKKLGLHGMREPLSVAHFRRVSDQMTLF